MEVMDTSLDKFYKKIYEDGQIIPETVLGIITLIFLFSGLAQSKGLYTRFLEKAFIMAA
jgi:hypothetical protein